MTDLLSEVTRADVVAEARAWRDTSWVHQGRSRAGVDCAGLVIVVARELGIVAPTFDVTAYGRVPRGTELLSECDRWMTRIDTAAIRPGDVLACRFELDPQHLGIVADYVHGGLSIIHAYAVASGGGRVIEHRLALQFQQKAVAAWSLPGVV